MGHNRRLKPQCSICSDTYSAKRANAGYHICMPCGDAVARATIRTIVPMHKSNYMLITDLDDLKGINNKGGLFRGNKKSTRSQPTCGRTL